jgi:gamma-butyrobetaine dioxygenase
MRTTDRLADLFTTRGATEYLREAVSIATHMLQAGALAEAAGAAPELVAAALLHDVGHLMAPTSDDMDAQHEEMGARWLAACGFSKAVTEPVRLHVAAKRYLCALEPMYFEGLSPASRHSLLLQGGVMTEDEAQAFALLEYADAAVAVRRWDEAAKDPARATPAFEHFRPLLEELLLSR